MFRNIAKSFYRIANYYFLADAGIWDGCPWNANIYINFEVTDTCKKCSSFYFFPPLFHEKSQLLNRLSGRSILERFSKKAKKLCSFLYLSLNVF